MTDAELMQKTGWGKKRLRSVYRRKAWHDVTHRETDLFLWACGMHPSKQRRYVFALNRVLKSGRIRKLRHLRMTGVAWQENQIRTLLRMCERGPTG